MREIHRMGPSKNLREHMEQLKHHRNKAEELDVLLTGRVDKLMLEEHITNEMATSLMNDSANASRITQMLVEIATLLYAPTDALLNHIDEQAPSAPESGIEAASEGSVPLPTAGGGADRR